MNLNVIWGIWGDWQIGVRPVISSAKVINVTIGNFHRLVQNFLADQWPINNLPVFVGIDYHQKVIQVCVMDQQQKILLNQTGGNDPEAVFRTVAPYTVRWVNDRVEQEIVEAMERRSFPVSMRELEGMFRGKNGDKNGKKFVKR